MRLNGSSPEVGSSKMSISGLPMMAMAMDSLRLFPPESYLTCFLRSLSMFRVVMMLSMWV
jgi:hypothetical protein